MVPVIYTNHVPTAFSAINKLVVVTLPLPQLTVCVSPLGLVIVRLCANIAPFPPITDALEQSTVTSFTIALSGRPLKIKSNCIGIPCNSRHQCNRHIFITYFMLSYRNYFAPQHFHLWFPHLFQCSAPFLRHGMPHNMLILTLNVHPFLLLSPSHATLLLECM